MSEFKREAQRHRDLARQKRARIQALGKELAALSEEVIVHENTAKMLDPDAPAATKPVLVPDGVVPISSRVKA